MLLIDQARWAAHGTTFAHLASDSSLGELHAFARANQVGCRAFDHDHYDISAARVDELVAAGALPVASAELVARVAAAGLRVRGTDRAPKRGQAVRRLRTAWTELLPQAPELGAELIARWSEDHRHYHDVRHLAQVLAALTELCAGPPPVTVALAAWFHDAVYAGVAGDDERASATLAQRSLAPLVGETVANEVARLVGVTEDHRPASGDTDGALLSDADLSILGQVPGRYQLYVRDVRLEHPDLSPTGFGKARHAVVEALLSMQVLYRCEPARHRWLQQARQNLAGESRFWSSFLTQ